MKFPWSKKRDFPQELLDGIIGRDLKYHGHDHGPGINENNCIQCLNSLPISKQPENSL